MSAEWLKRAVTSGLTSAEDKAGGDFFDAMQKQSIDLIAASVLASIPAEAVYDAVLATIILKAYEFTDEAEVTPQQVARAIVESMRRVLER